MYVVYIVLVGDYVKSLLAYLYRYLLVISGNVTEILLELCVCEGPMNIDI